jgi:hypothetical protein
MVVFMCGMALVILACCYYLADVRKVTWWTKPFVIVGVNSLFLWVLGGDSSSVTNLELIKIHLANGTQISLKTMIFRFFASWIGPVNGSELYAAAWMALWLGILAVMYKKRNRKTRGEGKPETFTFLGFTHYCGKRRSNGAFIVWRETAKKRLVAKLHAVQAELHRQMHAPTSVVSEWLQRVTLGDYQCHAIPGKLNRLRLFRHRLRLLWRRVLVRRSQKRRMSWERLNPLLDRWIPVPRVYPTQRFLARHPR